MRGLFKYLTVSCYSFALGHWMTKLAEIAICLKSARYLPNLHKMSGYWKRDAPHFQKEGMKINTSETKNLLDDLQLDKSLKAPAPFRNNKWLVTAIFSVSVVAAGLIINSVAQPSFAKEGNEVETQATPAKEPSLNKMASNGQPISDHEPVIKATANQMHTAATVPSENVQVNASGYVLAEKSATVSSDTTGRLKEILVKEGEHVVKGQLLATIDQRVAEAQMQLTKVQLETAKTTYNQTAIRLDEAQRKYQRIQALSAKQFVSEEQLDNARYTFSILQAELATNSSNIKVAEQQLSIQQQLLENAKIYAPFSGIVTELAAEVGEIVSPISAGGGFTRTGICTIIDIESLKVEVQVSEQYIEKIRLGQAVNVNSIAYPNEKITGVVSHIMPQANRETASITVKIKLLNTRENIVPNMRVDVAFLEKGVVRLSQSQSVKPVSQAMN